MKIDVWSDIACPFCYIGKQQLYEALKKTSLNNVEIEFHAFLLDPSTITDTVNSYAKVLSLKKGWSLEQTHQIFEQVKKMGKEQNLDFNFDKAITASTLKAHQLVEISKSYGLQIPAIDALYKAHFSDGKNIDDEKILLEICKQISLPEKEFQNKINTQPILAKVENDLKMARDMRISGVPFFVFNHKKSISGAQGSDVFLSLIKQINKEPNTLQNKNNTQASCNSSGECK